MNSKKPIEKCDAIFRLIFSFNCDTIEMCAVNLNVCSNVHIVRWFYTWGFKSVWIFKKKNQRKDNNQRDFIIKIWTFLVVTKSCLLLRDDGRKQRLDINLIGVIYWCLYRNTGSNFNNKHASDLEDIIQRLILIHLVNEKLYHCFFLFLYL